jgi:hypothetical protein
MSDEVTEINVQIQPVPNTMHHVGKLWYAFDGVMLGRVEHFEVFFPMDRRQARRVSRKLKRRFTIRNGEVVWRKTG